MSEQIENFKKTVVNIGFEPLKVFAASLEGAILDLDGRLSALEGQLKKSDSHPKEARHHD